MARPEPPTPEVERLVRAYARYDADPANQARWSPDNPGNRAIHAERAERVADLLGRPGRGVGPLLDLGCGSGQMLAELPTDLSWRPIVGVDLRAERLALASERVAGASFSRAEATTLPFPSAAFGAVLIGTLFSSVLERRLAGALAAEVVRVLAPGGVVVWYDLRRRNPANSDVRPLGRSDVQRLFPGWEVDLRPVTVLPPLVRRLGPATERLYPLLARVSPLTTHLLGTLVKPG